MLTPSPASPHTPDSVGDVILPIVSPSPPPPHAVSNKAPASDNPVSRWLVFFRFIEPLLQASGYIRKSVFKKGEARPTTKVWASWFYSAQDAELGSLASSSPQP